jgi:hypothetical protein
MKTHIIAGIGNRHVSEHILKEAIKIGAWCRDNKIYVRSGHAEGMDWAFEQGAQEFCITYLPWKNFNKQFESRALKCVVPYEDKYNEMTDKYHPACTKLSSAALEKDDPLSRGARLLMNRNACQVLGYELDSPVDVVVCWTPDPEFKRGGTSQACRIAVDNNIPVINMLEEKFNTAEKVIAKLREIFHE